MLIRKCSSQSRASDSDSPGRQVYESYHEKQITLAVSSHEGSGSVNRGTRILRVIHERDARATREGEQALMPIGQQRDAKRLIVARTTRRDSQQLVDIVSGALIESSC